MTTEDKPTAEEKTKILKRCKLVIIELSKGRKYIPLDVFFEELKVNRREVIEEIREFAEQKKEACMKSSNAEAEAENIMLAYDFHSRYIAMKHFEEYLSSLKD